MDQKELLALQSFSNAFIQTQLLQLGVCVASRLLKKF